MYEDILNAGTTIVETPKGKYIIAGDIKTGYVILDITNKMPVFNTVFEEIYWDGYGNGYSEHQWVKKNGKWGVINIYNGEIILEFEFDEINHYRGDYYETRKVDKWGAFNKENSYTHANLHWRKLKRKGFKLENLFFH